VNQFHRNKIRERFGIVPHDFVAVWATGDDVGIETEVKDALVFFEVIGGAFA
jgi:bifunctional DNA-binding transcriptional regulator/antitoxin component of YhaV-PrlF toxin-antitoxin module